MDEIKDFMSKHHIPRATADYQFTSEQLMRLIELVEETQANYILDRIQDNYKEPTRWVSQQLTE